MCSLWKKVTAGHTSVAAESKRITKDILNVTARGKKSGRVELSCEGSLIHSSSSTETESEPESVVA